MYSVELRDWEKSVLKTEMRREGFKVWYRNPDRPTQDSLGIAYVDGDDIKILRPDFLFFAEEPSGNIVADIVDPHGYHLADALPKLRGLASYAESHGTSYRRIQAVAEVGGTLRMLHLTSAEVRRSVMSASSAKELFESLVARDYA